MSYLFYCLLEIAKVVKRTTPVRGVKVYEMSFRLSVT